MDFSHNVITHTDVSIIPFFGSLGNEKNVKIISFSPLKCRDDHLLH